VKEPRLIAKPVPAVTPETLGPVGVSAVVLQVIPRRVFKVLPVAGVMKTSLFAVTIVVLTTHVAPDAATLQEKAPAGAAVQVTTEGLAAVPAAAHFVLVSKPGALKGNRAIHPKFPLPLVVPEKFTRPVPCPPAPRLRVEPLKLKTVLEGAKAAFPFTNKPIALIVPTPMLPPVSPPPDALTH
jgi:hypothetical protein